MRNFTPIIIIILVIIVLDLGATYYVGNIAEKKVRQTVALINEIPGTKINIQSYERGFFSSAVTFSAQILGQDYTILSKVYHGPIIFKSGDGSPLKLQLAYVTNKLQNPPFNIPITWSVGFPYGGGAKIRSHNPEYQVEQNGLLLKSKGWDANGTISSNWDSFKLETASPEFTLENTGNNTGPVVDVAGIKFDSEYNKNNDTKTMLHRYSFDRAFLRQMATEINKASIRVGTTAHKDSIDFLLGIDLNSIAIGPATFGPERFLFKIENIDLAALAIVLQNSDKGLSPEQSQQVMKDILQRRINIAIEKSIINLPEGMVSVDLKLTVGGEGIKDPSNLDEVLSTADGYLNLIATKSLVRSSISQHMLQNLMKDPNFQSQTPAQKLTILNQAVESSIKALLNDRILIDQDKNYELKITVEKGQWISPVTHLPRGPITSIPTTTTEQGSATAAPGTTMTPTTAPGSATTPATTPRSTTMPAEPKTVPVPTTTNVPDTTTAPIPATEPAL